MKPVRPLIKPFIISAIALFAFSGADGSGGCDGETLPSVEQIDLNLPSELRTCKYAPRSPGQNATRRQTARYIVALYDAWKDCHGNNQQIDALYKQYRVKIEKLRAKYK